jgi:ribose transport system permease protein
LSSTALRRWTMSPQPSSVEAPSTDAPATNPSTATDGNSSSRWGDVRRRYALIFAWLLVIIGFGIAKPDTFLTFDNAQIILGSQAVLLILSLGLIVPLAAGEFDLSFAGVLSMSLVLMGWLNVQHGWGLVPTLIVVVAAGLLIGAINAFVVVVVGVESIVATLGMGTLLQGLALAINNNVETGLSSALVSATRTEFLGLPLIFFYAIGLTAVLWYVFGHTPLGRYLQFVGAGRHVARLAGVRVDAVRAGAMMFCSVTAALAGVALAGYLGAVDPNVGQSFLLPTFAAVFLGATVIQPGRFNPWGTAIAVYFLITGITGLQLLGLSGWIEQVFYGAALLAAVIFSRLAGGRARVGA